MSAREWEQVHRAPQHYVVAPQHEDVPEREVVVSQQTAYWIVRKVGETAAAAHEAERVLGETPRARR